TVTADIDEAVEGTDFLVLSIPTKYVREMLTRLAPALAGDQPVISVVKGIENDSFLRPSQIVTDVLGTGRWWRCAAPVMPRRSPAGCRRSSWPPPRIWNSPARCRRC